MLSASSAFANIMKLSAYVGEVSPELALLGKINHEWGAQK